MAGKPTYEELEQRITDLAQEVAERKEIEKTLKRNQQFLAEAENIGNVGSWELDAKTKNFTLSEGALRIFGVRPGEFQPSYDDFLSRVHPEDRDKVIAAIADTIGEKGTSLLVDYRILRTEESPRWVRSKAEAICDDAANPIRFVGIVQDITERKAIEEALTDSEGKYRLLVDNANESILIIQDGVIKFANPRLFKVMGYSPEEIASKSFFSLIHPDDLDLVRERYRRRMAGEEVPSAYSFRAMRKDGSKLWAEVTAVVTEWEGKPATLNFLRDITERKQIEEELKKHRDDLEGLVKERTSQIAQTNEMLRERENELRANNTKLEEMNAALKVLLKSRETDKAELEEKVLSNVKNLVVPYLEKVKKSGLDETQAVYVEILESNLNDIISPFSRTLSSKFWNFTPTEIEIANLVKEGKTTKEIAQLLNSSRRTIEFHRDNLRKKLGLKNRRANLKTHLLTNY